MSMYDNSGGFGTALGYYSGQAAPQMNYLGSQDALIRLHQAASQGQYGLGQQGLQSQYNIGSQRLGLNQQANQAAMKNPQADIAYWKGLGDLASQYYGTQTGLIGQARGLRGQQTDISLGDLSRAYGHNKFQFGSQQTGRGAWNTEGTTEGFGNLATQYDYSQQALRNQQAQANVGFDTQQASAYNNFQQDVLRSTHGQAQADSQLQQLGIKAKEFGLDQQELANQLQQGLSKLNLDQTVSIADLMGALSSNDLQRQQLANQVVSQAVEASRYMQSYGGTPAPSPIPSTRIYGQGAHFR